MLFNLFHYFVVATCTHTHDTASTVQRMEILEHTAAIVNDANKISESEQQKRHES